MFAIQTKYKKKQDGGHLDTTQIAAFALLNRRDIIILYFYIILYIQNNAVSACSS